MRRPTAVAFAAAGRSRRWSVGIALSDLGPFSTAAALAQAAAEMKTVAKRQSERRVALDRRQARGDVQPEAQYRRS